MTSQLNTTICICGGGSLGHVCSAMASAHGFIVNLLTNHPLSWSHNITVTDPLGNKICGNLNKISSDPANVIDESDIVLLCVPGYLIEPILHKIKPWLKSNAAIGAIVASTGFFFRAHEIFSNDAPQCLFGFQRVPFIARTVNYGKECLLLGYKQSLNIAIENNPTPKLLADKLAQAFSTPITILDNFYEASLTNSNPILHTGRMYALWGPEAPEERKHTHSLFYADWDDTSSEIVLGMDNEFMELIKKIGIRKGVIPSLLEYYESHDIHSLTHKIRSIPAFKTIISPMRDVNGTLAPDYTSRYFTEDFPHGLSFIAALARTHGVSTPLIDRVLAWGLKITQSSHQP